MKLLSEELAKAAKAFPSNEPLVFKGVKRVILEDDMVAMYPGETAPAAAPAPAPAAPAPAPVPDPRMAQLEKDMKAMQEMQAKMAEEKAKLEKDLAEKAKEIEKLKTPGEPQTTAAPKPENLGDKKKTIHPGLALKMLADGFTSSDQVKKGKAPTA